MYPVAGAFANPPTTTEGAHIPNPWPLRAMTSVGKEIVYLSREEFVGSSNGELSSWSNIFAGVLRDQGIDPEEKKKKPPKKKKVITIDPEPTNKKGGSSHATTGTSEKGTLRFRQSNLEDNVITSDALEGLSHIGEKKSSSAGSRSSGSAGSRNPEAGATPSSITLDKEEEEEEKEEEEEPAAQLVSRKRSREKATADVKVAQKTREVPVIGKQSKLRTLYKFSPEAKKKTPEKGVVFKDPKELAQKKTKFVIKHPQTPAAATIAQDKAQGPEVVRITGLDQPLYEKKKETSRCKGPEIVKLTKPVQVDTPTQTVQVTSTTGGSAAAERKEATTDASGVGASVDVRSSAFAVGQAGMGSQSSLPHPPIGPKDTLGDI
ncbi:hypothetical protein HanOQP8_Chr01g0011091 [Helianthus annuus]|nr:hypothetical protein HanOQP8_Chr01g0011091 [Helianthus annuus]